MDYIRREITTMKIRTFLTLLLVSFSFITNIFAQQSITDLTEQAKKGDVEAMLILAEDAEKMHDYKEALDWYKKAEKKKSPVATYKLAMYDIHGYAGKEDIKKGIKLLQKAVEMNYPDAQATLANYYETGWDKYLPQDKDLAYSLRMEAAKANNKAALDALASKLNQVSEDRKIEMLEVLASIGKYPDAAASLAGIYFDNDKERALSVLTGFDEPQITTLSNFINLSKRAEQGDSKAFYELAAFYAPEAEPFSVTPALSAGPDEAKEKELLTKAADGGLADAYFKLKDYWLRHGDKKKALAVIESLADKGNSDAMISAGILAANELNDYPAAYNWLLKAKESGNPNLSMKFNNYGNEYLSFRGEAKEIDKNAPVKLRSYCFGINNGKKLEPGSPDYLKYLKEMERSGEFIIEITPQFIQAISQYDQVDPFSEGLAIVSKNGKKGAINTLGEEVIPCILSYNHIAGFSDGLAEVFKGVWDSNESGYIDMKGNLVISLPKGTDTRSFNEGLALVYSYTDFSGDNYNSKFNVIDKEGKTIFSGQLNADMFGDGGLPDLKFRDGKINIPFIDSKTDDAKIAVYDRKGTRLATMNYDWDKYDFYFNDRGNSNYRVVRKMAGPYDDLDYQWDASGLETKEGQEILPVMFDWLIDLMDTYGVAYFHIHEVLGQPYISEGGGESWVSSDKDVSYQGFIDKNGNSTISPEIINRCWDSYNIAARLLHDGQDNQEVAKYLSSKTYSNKISTQSATDIESPVNNNRGPANSNDIVYQAVEQQAEFPGGQTALMKWLSNNIRYPDAAHQNEIQGRVVVKFIVEKDGSISNAEVVRAVDNDLDQEALRVVNKMPKWQPGKNAGEVVRSYFTMPVTFKLQSQ